MRSRTLRASSVVGTLVIVAGLGISSGAAAPADLPPTRTGRIEKVDFDELARRRALWVPDELIVGFKPDVSRSAAARSIVARGARVKDRIGGLGVSVVDLPNDQSVAAALGAYRRSPLVEFAEPNKIIYGAAIPNDPRFSDLWGLHNTGQAHRVYDDPPLTASGTPDADGDVPEAWDEETGSAETVIAVLDSGVDVDHPDLNASIWVNPDEVPGNGLDDDLNGYIDDVNGWDFAEDDDTLLENDNSIHGAEHGTHVAGTVAAEMNNGAGVAGVCPGCKVMVLKFMKPRDTDGDNEPDTMVGTLAAELKGIEYARQEDADIVNASFSTFLWSGVERRAYNRLGNAGVLTVAAAGNSSLDNDLFLSYQFPNGSMGFSPEYPASFTVPEILSVAASNHKDEYGYFTGCDTELARWKCEFTSWGHDSVDLAAPGVDISSTIPVNAGSDYRELNGTSMAAPFTAGAAGLVLSLDPTLGPNALKNALMNSVDQPNSLRKMPAFKGGAARGRFTRTSGRVNVHDALSGDTANATPQTDGNVDGATRLRKSKTGRVNWPADTNDVYKRRFRKGKEYRVVLNGPNSQDFDLVAWKPRTKEIWQLEDGCFFGGGKCKLLRYVQKQDSTAADESFRFTAKETGNFYIHVSAFLFNKGDYKLRVRRI